MERHEIAARPHWEKTVESLGFTFHHDYWDEGAYYQFTADEVDQIERATNDLEEKCLAVVDYVIKQNLFDRMGIPKIAVQRIVESWEKDEMNIYGRFDFGYDGENLKLFEYNADTPTSLFEAAVVQWQWLQDRFPTADQFNSIHERLIDAWRKRGHGSKIHFACFEENPEDEITSRYLADTASQAGFEVASLDISEIGSDDKAFFDRDNKQVETLFKLYPWEMMWADRFGEVINSAKTRMIEPPWKLVLSNKALLPLLWKLNPGHPNLLPASFDAADLSGPVVRKPFFGREGANIAMGRCEKGAFSLDSETPGDYGAPYIYQQAFQSTQFNRQGQKVQPLIGSWVIASESAGIGIREDSGITSNKSRFVPHLFV